MIDQNNSVESIQKALHDLTYDLAERLMIVNARGEIIREPTAQDIARAGYGDIFTRDAVIALMAREHELQNYRSAVQQGLMELALRQGIRSAQGDLVVRKLRWADLDPAEPAVHFGGVPGQYNLLSRRVVFNDSNIAIMGVYPLYLPSPVSEVRLAMGYGPGRVLALAPLRVGDAALPLTEWLQEPVYYPPNTSIYIDAMLEKGTLESVSAAGMRWGVGFEGYICEPLGKWVAPLIP